ncbi:2Fe-2S iron-sulfur cluster-binding protein [Fimbriimonas ginsengisoli]|uniref:Periplasmic aromatic aldehyde oxidoreductase, iron-sulfur subunit YagT n=1 Tax=Fimbriimonas ginsengisoli Gsoil 348 TaxID=661478 RepID=A0A068NKW0_FIMGI|nr:2Fe-2S iron-sulfur cluster-binding protein [Fimbriimonas ginsengisoli]AIE84042.1 Periplasmic aromatic aldehyde oxidoreductase, iron-sulfur subunit YagT [Fimbriimonas ginsengisoli Gsoil 348]
MESGIGIEAATVAVGDKAPDLELSEGVWLSDFRGSPLVLAFFPDDWDPARTSQLGVYQELLENLPDHPRLVGISLRGDWYDVEIQGEVPVRFPQLSSDGDLGRRFGVTGRQALFLIDSDGVVRWSHASPVGVHPRVDEVERALQELTAKPGISRRELLVATVAVTVALTVLPGISNAAGVAKRKSGGRTITLNVNGSDYKIDADPRVTLLDALRERMGLPGTKKGCDHGQCGACTVHVNGRRVNSCLMLAMQAEGAKVRTIEGLANGDALHPVQAAFIKHDGFQCGYCTPGQIMSAVACIQEGHAGSDEDIREFMSGNICRCGAYPGICAAIKEAREGMGGAR